MWMNLSFLLSASAIEKASLSTYVTRLNLSTARHLVSGALLPPAAALAAASRGRPHSPATETGSAGSIFPGASARSGRASRGLSGSWLEQQGRSSKAEGASEPSSCSRQKELGQKSQKEEAELWHTLHWCQGHSHLP